MTDNSGALPDDAKTTTAGEERMEGSSVPSKWTWLVPLVFLFFLVQALIVGATLPALAWLSLLVNGVLVASGVYKRSRALSYLALAFSLLGLLLLVTSILRDLLT
jgi:protein-S-isoprenylcysteine O-methyltransferase Ste14